VGALSGPYHENFLKLLRFIFFYLTVLPNFHIITISVNDDMKRDLEKSLKALGDRNRLRIINMLKDRAMCVCEITDVLKLSQSTVSGHLRILKEAGIAEDTKDGLWVEYHLCQDCQLNNRLLELAQSIFESDREMREERKKASQTDRRILCKK
jgi:ArsR family transcriptional regulator